jgi:tRNA A58 N-methylase Trm61
MYLDTRDVAVIPPILLDQYEKGVQRALQHLIQPGATVFEARAHQGYHTLTAAFTAGRTGCVIALEPEPIWQDVLRDNLAAHDLASHVKIANFEAQTAPLRETLSLCKRLPDVVRLDVGDQLAPSIANLWDLLTSQTHSHLVVSLPAGAIDPQPLRRLAASERGFWRIENDGSLVQSTLENILGAAGQQRIDVVVTRSLS